MNQQQGTQLGTNILACKLLRKCRKDEVPAGVIAVAAQCVEGTSMSWVPYLLNLFQEDCKDAGPRHKVPLLMADHPNSLHGMARTRVCNFLYQTTASGS
jgi:hypothetical protein